MTKCLTELDPLNKGSSAEAYQDVAKGQPCSCWGRVRSFPSLLVPAPCEARDSLLGMGGWVQGVFDRVFEMEPSRALDLQELIEITMPQQQ